MYELKIKDTRLKKGVTQKEVAEVLNISINYYSELESGKYPIKLNALYTIGQVLNVCMKDLFECNCKNKW